MKALVSGGTGLVGRYIFETLLGAGYETIICGRTQAPVGLFSTPVEFRPLKLDLDADHTALFAGIDVFIHAAFEHRPGRYRGGEGDDPAGFRRKNVDGSVSLFTSAKRAGVRRAVFLSSRAVYDGLPSGVPLTEDANLAPTSLYGKVKLLGEQGLAALNGPDFITASLRLTGVYGELRPNKWDELFAAYLAGEQVPVRAGSEVHGRDVGQAVRLMLEADPGRISGQAFNVSDLTTDTHEILSALRDIKGGGDLPAPADKSNVAEMSCEKIAALDWLPGGRTLFRETISRLATG